MRKAWIFFVVFLFLSNNSNADIERYRNLPSCVFADGLTSIRDLEQKGYTVGGNPTISDKGLGNGLDLNGSGDYVDLNTKPTDFSRSFSIIADIYLNDISAGNHQIVATGAGAKLYRTGTDLTYYTGADATTASSVFAANTSYHIAVTYDGTTLRIYIDGAEVATEVKATTDGSGDTFIGSLLGTDEYLNAVVQNVAIFNRQLTAIEVDNIAKRKAFDYAKNLAHFYGLGELNAVDTGVAIQKNGTGSEAVVVDGKIGKALDFDGNNDYVNCGDITELNNATEFTIDFWMNQDIIDQIDIFWYKQIDANNYIFSRNYTDGYLYVAIATTATGVDYGYFDYSTAISANSWHYIAWVFDGSGAGNSDRLKCYVDGVNQTLNFGVYTIPAVLGDMSGSDFYICHTSTVFDGTLDEFGIYNKALTYMQVEDLYVRKR